MIQKKRLWIIFILILSILTILSNASIATKAPRPDHNKSVTTGDPLTNPNAYKPGSINVDDANVVISKAGVIFNVVSTVGIVVAVITIIIIGIKYMVGSIEEKAEYKKTMIPYLIGVFMIASISAIIKLVANLAANIE